MKIINKFDYKKYPRLDTPDGRKYLINEQPLPSVTTILSAMANKSHLIEWKKRVGEEEAERIKMEASGIGTSMHNNLENYILGKPMTGNLMSKVLANLIIKKAFPKINEIWGSEVCLYTDRLYAGTTDLVGIHDGQPAIMDYKNSLKEKKREWIEDYFMQLAAYSISHNEMFGTSISKGVVMIATREGTYQEFIIEGDEFLHYQTKWANTVLAFYDR